MVALTDGAILLIVSQIGVYFALLKNKVRLWRIIGAFAFILVGISAVMIEDTPIALVFAGISLIIGGIQLFTDISNLI